MFPNLARGLMELLPKVKRPSVKLGVPQLRRPGPPPADMGTSQLAKAQESPGVRGGGFGPRQWQ
jgi:hypothetical protein